MSTTLSKSSCGSLRTPDASVDTCPRTAPDSSPPPPPPPPPFHPRHPGTHFGAPGRRPRRCNNDRRIALYRALGSAGAWVSSPEGGRHRTATPSGQQLPKECRPSSDPARCPCRPLGPPATVTPGRLLASPVSPLKGQTDWVLSPLHHDTVAGPRRGVVVVVVVVVVEGGWEGERGGWVVWKTRRARRNFASNHNSFS